MPRTHRECGPPWKCPPDLIPHVVAGCYSIDKPIPSDFLCLSDKGQKSNDKVADPQAWEERQAGGALEIREGGSSDSTSHPRCSQPWIGGPAATGCGRLATLEIMNEGGPGGLTDAVIVHQGPGRRL